MRPIPTEFHEMMVPCSRHSDDSIGSTIDLDFLAEYVRRTSNPPRSRYSVRSARVGDIDAARLAGMSAANNAHVARELAATVSAKGSQNDTP
jgi:hypothetical protein